jgi:hypothetical protein
MLKPQKAVMTNLEASFCIREVIFISTKETVPYKTGSVAWSGSMDVDKERRTSCANF